MSAEAHAGCRRAASGDTTAWSSLVDVHLPRMRSYARGFAVAVDVQESACTLAWLRLAQSLDAPPADLSSWLLEQVRDEIARHQPGAGQAEAS